MYEPSPSPPMSTLSSRRSSIQSENKYSKYERTDPEGDVDELDELAMMLHRQNEERKMKQLEKRAAYNAGLYTATLPPDTLRSLSNKRSQSIGSLRPKRQVPEEYELSPRPLVHSKSASQSRSSVRSLKKKAPQPPIGAKPLQRDGLPAVPPPLYGETTASRQHTPRSSQRHPTVAPPMPPSSIYSQPYQRDNPYAAPHQHSMVSSPSTLYSDNEETVVLRPTPGQKPAVPRKPSRSNM